MKKTWRIRGFGITNSWGITIINTREVEWWVWANPIGVAVKVGPVVINLSRPVPYPKYWRRLAAWVRTWGHLMSIPTEAEAKRGFYIARPRPEWVQGEPEAQP